MFIEVLHTPLQTSDLNPIENLWDQLGQRIRKIPINSKIELQTRLKKEWATISSEYLKKVIFNTPKRLQEVNKQNGYATKY